jgi:hypothetical protein
MEPSIRGHYWLGYLMVLILSAYSGVRPEVLRTPMADAIEVIGL